MKLALQVVRVPETTLRFDDSPEGPPEPRKAVVLILMVYYSERIYIKISKGKMNIGQSPGEAR